MLVLVAEVRDVNEAGDAATCRTRVQHLVEELLKTYGVGTYVSLTCGLAVPIPRVPY